MAIWQYSFYIAPKERVLIQGQSPIYLSEQQKNEAISWSCLDSMQLVEETLDNLLNKNIDESSKSMRIWGTLEGTHATMSSYDDIFEILFRLDVRIFTIEFLNRLVDALSYLNSVIITDKCKTLLPSNKLILGEIMNSGSFKFLQNPEEIIGELE